jgi:hypothetical protein
MIRRILLLALVAVMPFSGLRVWCVDVPPAETTSTSHAHTSDCERLCPLPPAAARSSSESDCAMSVDGSLIIMTAAIAVSPVQEPLQRPSPVSHEFSEPSHLLLEPALVQPNPPPESTGTA